MFEDDLKFTESDNKEEDIQNKEALFNSNNQLELQSLEDLEKELIPNPTSQKDKARNKKIQSKIAYQNALNDIYLKRSSSIRKAAEKYNVDFSTLAKMIRTSKFYQGKGKRSPYFTDDEEKIVVNRALELINSGQTFSSMIFRNIIEEEFEVIKINFPDRVSNFEELRGNTKKFGNYCSYVAKRNDLRKYYAEDTRERNFECDVCLKCFRTKKAVLGHQKNIHYSFMS